MDDSAKKNNERRGGWGGENKVGRAEGRGRGRVRNRGKAKEGRERRTAERNRRVEGAHRGRA